MLTPWGAPRVSSLTPWATPGDTRLATRARAASGGSSGLIGASGCGSGGSSHGRGPARSLERVIDPDGDVIDVLGRRVVLQVGSCEEVHIACQDRGVSRGV